MTWLVSLSLLSFLLPCFSTSNAFYIPGVNPRNFYQGDEIKVDVNAITSSHTQIPKPYYYLPFCAPSHGPKTANQNLGQYLTGNYIQTSDYKVHMLEEKSCQILCQRTLDAEETERLQEHIRYGYNNNWIIDNMPSAWLVPTYRRKFHTGGIPIGVVSMEKKEDSAEKKKDVYYIFNHVNIILDYHNPEYEWCDKKCYRVVGFSVDPVSINHAYYSNDGYVWDGKSSEGYSKVFKTCMEGKHWVERQIVQEGENIIFTYDVIWRESDTIWAHRWDIYLSEGNPPVPTEVLSYAIVNLIIVIMFLSLMIVRILKKNIAVYNSLSPDVKADQDKGAGSGWKLIHADVFRPPSTMPMLYCVLVGSGAQLALSAMFTICLGVLGLVNPARRGSLLTCLLWSYMMCGILSGYTSSRLYKTFRGRSYQVCTLVTATLFPGICFAVFLFFNTLLAFHRSSGSVSLFHILVMAVMWCGVSIPLVFIGAYFGYKKKPISFPTVTSTIARAVPPPSNNPCRNPKFGILVAGISPFCAAYVELFFIMKSLWKDQYYNLFGFTLAVYLILLVTSAEITTLITYYQLVAENHRWWWLAMISSGSVSFYIFGYSVLWFNTLEQSDLWVTYMLYFGYMFLLSFAVFIAVGAVGSITTLLFVRKMYSFIKEDTMKSTDQSSAVDDDNEKGEEKLKQEANIGEDFLQRMILVLFSGLIFIRWAS